MHPDKRLIDLLKSYSNKEISNKEFNEKLIELCNTITDERDRYKEVVTQKEETIYK